MIGPDRYPRNHRSHEERSKRLEVLRARLPKLERGYGISRREMVIYPHEASTDMEFEDALEFESILYSFSENKDVGLFSAVTWARRVFHEHGFPSSCWVCKEGGEWRVVAGERARQKTSLGARDCISIHIAILDGRLRQAEEGSRLYYAGVILSRFCTYQRHRRELTAVRQSMLRADERLVDVCLAGSEDNAFECYDLKEGILEKESDFEDGERALAHMFEDIFYAGLAYGEAMIRADIEDDALSKRQQRSLNRANARKAAEANARRAQQRKTHWFAFLDECSESKSWLLKSDPQKLSSAIRGFEKRLKDNEELVGLFRRAGKAWYDETFEEWRRQRIEIAKNSEI